MSSAALETRVAQPLPVVGAAALLVAATIAWLQPFDRIFRAATGGEPWLRASLIVALAGVGVAVARALGLRLRPVSRWSALGLPLLAATAVALVCVGADLVFRGDLDTGYIDGLTTTPLVVRVPVFMMHAFNEEVLYRLFLGGVLAWLLTQAAPASLRTYAVWGGFALAQAVNVAANVASSASLSVGSLSYETVRFFAPGLVWSWLYIRRGFGSAVLGHVSTHLLFQPLVGLVLTA